MSQNLCIHPRFGFMKSRIFFGKYTKSFPFFQIKWEINLSSLCSIGFDISERFQGYSIKGEIPGRKIQVKKRD